MNDTQRIVEALRLLAEASNLLEKVAGCDPQCDHLDTVERELHRKLALLNSK